jgi:hypothetical protein
VAVIFAPEVGAVYTHEVVPAVQLATLPPPEALQVTPAFLESLVTVAVMVRVCPWSIACEPPGNTETEIGGGPAGVFVQPETRKPVSNPTHTKMLAEIAENLFISCSLAQVKSGVRRAPS